MNTYIITAEDGAQNEYTTETCHEAIEQFLVDNEIVSGMGMSSRDLRKLAPRFRDGAAVYRIPLPESEEDGTPRSFDLTLEVVR